jgi:hypothetical protein
MGHREVQIPGLVNASRPVVARLLLPYGEHLATSASISISVKLPGNAGHGQSNAVIPVRHPDWILPPSLPPSLCCHNLLPQNRPSRLPPTRTDETGRRRDET